MSINKPKGSLVRFSVPKSMRPLPLKKLTVNYFLKGYLTEALELIIEECFEDFMRSRLQNPDFIYTHGQDIDLSAYTPDQLMLLLKQKRSFNALHTDEQFFFNQSLLFIFCVMGISNEIVKSFIDDKKVKIKFKKWDYPMIQSVLNRLSNYSFDNTDLLPLIQNVQAFFMKRHMMEFSSVDLQALLQDPNIASLESDLSTFISKAIAIVYTVFGDLLESTSVTRVMDRINSGNMLKRRFDFESFEFGFTAFHSPAAPSAPQLVQQAVVKTPVKEVLEVPKPIVEELPQVDPALLGRVLHTIDELEELATHIPYYNDLFAVSYFDVLPTQNQMRSTYHFINSVTQGTFQPNTTNSHDFTEHQLTKEYLEAKQQEAVRKAQEIKKSYREYLGQY